MELIVDKEELMRNIEKLDDYLNGKKDPENGFALDLIKKGVCFIAVQTNEGYRFYPSRFLGYKNNDITNYLANELKQGKEVNPTISSLIGCNPTNDLELEKEYKKYCEKLGFIARNKGAFGVERKYWILRK